MLALTISTLLRRRPPIAEPAFTPASLFTASEQGAWYDPSDLSTLYQDSAGTTPVTTVEQPVGKMLDKSGNGNHATQATSTARPVLKQDAGGRYYLAFDGSDDSMATASIDFSATDEMSVFAGLTKLSDAADGIVVELSANANTNNGAFWLAYKGGAPGDLGGFATRGTLFAYAATNSAAYAAPITSVLTGLSDISDDSVIFRIDGVQNAISSSNLGTGNFGNYPLYIGSRGGTTLRFNGRLYGLIVRGKTSTLDEITSTEIWMSGKTGV